MKSGVQRRSVFGPHANLLSIRILNRSDAIDFDHSLDATVFLRLSFGSMAPDADNPTLLQVLVLERVDRAEEHGSILRPVDRTDALRGFGACAPLGSHRERGA